ncbi:hypothetical protein YC2023_103871 [Brassica napus]
MGVDMLFIDDQVTPARHHCSTLIQGTFSANRTLTKAFSKRVRSTCSVGST